MINHEIIEQAVYNLCVEANTILPDSVFQKILNASKNEENKDSKQVLEFILKNAKTAYTIKKPLCQDTGQVVVFVKIGEEIQTENLTESINNGVQRAYKENFYRKSVVKNALFERANTNTNIPCIIYPEIVQGDEIEIELLIKGAGSENMSQVKMFSPTASEDEIVQFIKNSIQSAGSKPCPPLFLGVGIGGTLDYAAILSKKALLLETDVDENHLNFANKIKAACNSLNIGPAGYGGKNSVLDVKVLTDFTHIASMPVALTVNCHSSRHSKCIIKSDGVKYFEQNLIKEYKSSEIDFSDYKKVETSDIQTLKGLKQGDKILLTGEIYTARDMAHKRLVDMIEKKETLPFDLENKIIFYAGPCPCPEKDVIGSVGPTTSSRMDKYAPVLYKAGILATIGKGERSKDVADVIRSNNKLYFTLVGGISALLSTKIIKNESIAFEDLGTESINKLFVEGLPLKVELSEQ